MSVPVLMDAGVRSRGPCPVSLHYSGPPRIFTLLDGRVLTLASGDTVTFTNVFDPNHPWVLDFLDQQRRLP